MLLFLLLFSLSITSGKVYASNGAIFAATELLGRPTDSSVTVSVLAEQDLETYFEYGTEPSDYANQTSPVQRQGGIPFETVIGGLQNDTRYYYRMVYREINATDWIRRDEHSFRTQRG